MFSFFFYNFDQCDFCERRGERGYMVRMCKVEEFVSVMPRERGINPLRRGAVW